MSSWNKNFESMTVGEIKDLTESNERGVTDGKE